MSHTIQLDSCARCGAPVPSGAPRGLCPGCALTDAGRPGRERTLAEPAPEVPSRERVAAAFPRLEILELIGRGGMGFVFKARQRELDRVVALKLLPERLARDPHFAERFNREGRVLARLNHPNIVSVYDFGMTGQFCYLLMEFIDGVNLRQAMEVRRFPPEEALRLVPRICEALQYAHERGVLHRDIKPANILLDARGQVKIADFGIAKLLDEQPHQVTLTLAGALLGTPHYMAPEQLEDPAAVDQRADLYSLGVVFYELLTGELPLGRFAAPSTKTPVGTDVDDVVFRTLEKDPARRYQSAGEMKTEVELLRAGQAAPPASSRAATTQRRVSRFALMWIFIGLLAAALGAGLVLRTAQPVVSLPVPQRTAMPEAKADFVRPGARPIRATFRVPRGQVVTLELLNRDNDLPVPVPGVVGYAIAPDEERGRFSLLLTPTPSLPGQTNRTGWRLSLVSEDGASVFGPGAELGDLIANVPENYVHPVEADTASEIMLTRPYAGAETNGSAPHPLLSLGIVSRARGNLGGPQSAVTVSAGSTNWALALRQRATTSAFQPRPGEVLAYQWLKSPAGTNTTNTIRFTFTNVELRREDSREWLAIDYATDVRGDCEEVFRVDGQNFVTRKQSLLVTPEDSPAVRRQRFELQIPDRVSRTTVTELADEFAKALVGKSFVIPEGEQRPLLRFPVGTIGDVSLGIGARLRLPPP